MQKRGVRFGLLALLLAAGAGVSVLVWDTEHRARLLEEDRQDVDTRIDRVIADLSVIATAQHAYVAPGQPDESSIDLVSRLIKQITIDAGALRSRARSVEAAGHLEAFGDATTGFTQADARARENLSLGEDLSAADVIFGEARDIIGTMDTTLRALRTGEAAAFGASRAALAQQSWTAIGGLALLWLIGLIILVRVPVTPAVPVPAYIPAARADAIEPPAEQELTQDQPIVDLAAAADLCTAISRVTSADMLPDLLARAAAIIDARGIIIWMAAGEELFAAEAHGYDPQVISRLGPIGRAADNATAAAWRTGEMRIVAGDLMAHGAIVAPMFAADACIGVFAAEVRNGRQGDGTARAVTAMIAAQLATAVAAWPAASPQLEAEKGAGDTPQDLGVSLKA